MRLEVQKSIMKELDSASNFSSTISREKYFGMTVLNETRNYNTIILFYKIFYYI